MKRFAIKFEWEDNPAGVRGPELTATWGRLEIEINGKSLTEFEDMRIRTVRSGLYIPLYPLAEWLAVHWWWLWYEDRAPRTKSRHHSLLGAREGFPLPDLQMLPSEGRVRLSCIPRTHAPASVRFLNDAACWMQLEPVREECRRLVEAVVERLRERGIAGTFLHQEWDLVLQATAATDERLLCERAARLSLDPFALDAGVAVAIERIGHRLPKSVQVDFFNSVTLAQITAEGARLAEFFEESRQTDVSAAGWRLSQPSPTQSASPWGQGYDLARHLRTAMGFNGQRFTTPKQVMDQLGIPGTEQVVRDAPWRDMAPAAVGVSDGGGPVFAIASAAAQEARLFAFCRGLGEYIISPEPHLVTREHLSWRQKRGRAFAAEFLAPEARIRERLPQRPLVDADFDDLGREFGVSPLVIQLQVKNHRMAAAC